MTGLTNVTNGTVNFESPTSTTATLTQSAGVVGGAGALNVTGLFTCTGGTQADAGITNANAGMSISGNSKTLDTRTLNNIGTATWTDVNNISLFNNAVFNNPSGSTFNAQNNQFITATGTFQNGGTFTKSAGAGVTNVSVVFNNTGRVSSAFSGGTIALNTGGTHTGSFTAAAGATLDFGGGTHNLQAASSVTGRGRS